MIRVHELAADLEISSGELLHWFRNAGEFIKSASSVVQPAAERKAREAHPATEGQAAPRTQISVALLAKELHVRPNEILKAAERTGIHRTRVAALLSPSQADAVRSELAGKHLQQIRQVMAAPPRQVPAERVRAVARAMDGPVVGPPHACDCCGLRLPGHAVADEPSRCSTCSTHYAVSGEDNDRLMARLVDHDARLRNAYAVTWTQEHEAEEKMRGAFHSRDAWRGALVEVMAEHEESATGCRCGAKVFPCATWRYLERNRGILRQVEGFLAMKDDERERALYRRDHWDVA